MKEGGLLQMLVLEMHKCLDLSNCSLSFITLLLLDNLLQLIDKLQESLATYNLNKTHISSHSPFQCS
jgi:hypothetical protein